MHAPDFQDPYAVQPHSPYEEGCTLSADPIDAEVIFNDTPSNVFGGIPFFYIMLNIDTILRNIVISLLIINFSVRNI